MSKDMTVGESVEIKAGPVFNSGFAGMVGTFEGYTRSRRGPGPHLLVSFEGFGEPVLFFPEEVVAKGAAV